MKHWTWGILLLAAVVVGQLASAALTTDFKFSIESYENAKLHDATAYGDRLHVDIRMHGLVVGDCFRYAFMWKSPKPELFSDSTYAASKPAGDCDFKKALCWCADTKEKGCWRTRAYRTISGMWGGQTFRATGKWTVEVWKVNVVVVGDEPNGQLELLEKIGEATYEVK